MGAEAVEENNIRITISAQTPKAVDKACTEIVMRAKALNQRSNEQGNIKIKGPRPIQLDACESPPERPRAVKVPRPGTATRCESTSASSSSSAASLRSSTSPKCSSSQVYTLSSLSQRTKSGNRRRHERPTNASVSLRSEIVELCILQWL